MIASSLNTRVFMPDFFDPEKPFDVNRFPPKCDDDRAELSGFFSTTGKPQKAINKLRRFVEALKADNYKRIGVYGFCWGMPYFLQLFRILITLCCSQVQKLPSAWAQRPSSMLWA
jgi:dienelactone hydrolase